MYVYMHKHIEFQQPTCVGALRQLSRSCRQLVYTDTLAPTHVFAHERHFVSVGVALRVGFGNCWPRCHKTIALSAVFWVN